MKKTFIKIIISIFLVLISFSYTSLADKYYDILSYDINVNITENNIYEVQETITANFKTDRHGIFRTIPKRYYNYNHKIENISVVDQRGESYQYEVSYDMDNVVIKIGSPEIYVKGTKVYIISYTYDMGDDVDKTKDEVYWNLIGTDWDTTIYNANFIVSLPKQFDASKVNLTSGKYGSTQNDNVTWNTEGNTITGKVKSALNPFEALTIALPLDEGYFINVTPRPIDYMPYILIIPMIWVFVRSIKLYNEYKASKNKIVKTITFYPPEKLNPAELGYIYDKSVDNKDITSLIIYWANKGFIKIREEKQSSIMGMLSPNKFYLTKLKDIETNNPYEIDLFIDLFSYAHNNELDVSRLKDKFYMNMDTAKKALKKRIDKDLNVYDAEFDKRMMGTVVLSIIIYELAIASIINYWCGNLLISIIMAAPITMFSMFIIWAIVVASKYLISRNGIGSKVAAIVMLAFIVAYILIVGNSIISSYDSLLFIFVLITIIVIHILNMFLLLSTYMLTEKGIDILGKVLGFREFLFTAEKAQLEALVDQSPSYFYNILPYAIVLDVTDKWANKFEDLVSEPPSWYISNDNNVFRASNFANSMTHSMTTISNTMSSTPSSSSSGGSSGGGGGGGGGGSW